GDFFAADFPDGTLYRLPPQGGAVSTANIVADAMEFGPTLGQPTFGKDGRLYATRAATTGNFFTGALFEVDPVTGENLRTVASNLICPNGLSVDPLSGDLFFDDACTGAGSDDARIFRVVNPASQTP